jgi:hypothetical protein
MHDHESITCATLFSMLRTTSHPAAGTAAPIERLASRETAHLAGTAIGKEHGTQHRGSLPEEHTLGVNQQFPDPIRA